VHPNNQIPQYTGRAQDFVSPNIESDTATNGQNILKKDFGIQPALFREHILLEKRTRPSNERSNSYYVLDVQSNVQLFPPVRLTDLFHP